MRKSLTRLSYARILAAVAQSNEPLSSYQIINEMKNKRLLDVGNSGKDIFRMLRNLVPQDYILDKRTYLFSLNKHLSTTNTNYRANALVKIADFLQPVIDKENIKSFTIDKQKKDDDGCLYIFIKDSQKPKNIVVIKLGPVHKPASSSISFWKEKNIIIEKEIVCEKINDNNIMAYAKKENKDKTKFLGVTLNEGAREKHPLIDKYWNYLENKEIHSIFEDIPAEISSKLMENHDCMEIIFNSKYWRYKINLRGFLICIFVLASYSSKQNTKILHDIISSKSILQIAPFLMHYKDFEKVGFNVVMALREIAYKFQHELDYNSNSDTC